MMYDRLNARNASRAIMRSSSVGTTSTAIFESSAEMRHDLVEAARVAVALRVEHDAHALQALQRQRSHLRAALADAAGENHRVQPAHRGHIGADVFPHAVAVRLERHQRAGIVPRRQP